jgi:hypothetical protein
MPKAILLELRMGWQTGQRILAANIEDVKITLGESLLPTILRVSDFVKREFVPALQGLVDGLTRSGKQSLSRAFYDVRHRCSHIWL